MQAPAQTVAKPDPTRAWWLRVLAVLLSPRAVFAALRDESEDDVQARQEPVAAIAGLAGIALLLATPSARRLANDANFDALGIAVWLFIGGALNALGLYWILGALLHGGGHALGSQGTYRRARHVLGFAAAPLALSLLLFWPVRIAVYGLDLFRTGGDDYGIADAVFGWVFLGFVAWTGALLLLGVRTVHGWGWPRAVGAVAVAAIVPVLLVVATTL
jgi:hypothetical protein